MARLILATLTACILAAPVAAADAKCVKIIHVKTGKVLAVDKDSDESGARAVLAKDDNSKARQWKLKNDGDYFELINRQSGKVLDAFEEAHEVGTPIIVWDEKTEGMANQRWAWQGSGKERRLKTKLDNLVLDIEDADKLILQKPDDKAESQLWRIVEVKE